MKNLLTILFILMTYQLSFAVVSDISNHPDVKAQFANLSPELQKLSIDEFLSITPKRFKEVTGKRMGFKNAVKLKVAQKVIKRKVRKGTDISSGLYVLLAILGLGWLAMGLIGDWEGEDWIINLILTILCWLPGLIHALVKKSDYV